MANQWGGGGAGRGGGGMRGRGFGGGGLPPGQGHNMRGRGMTMGPSPGGRGRGMMMGDPREQMRGDHMGGGGFDYDRGSYDYGAPPQQQPQQRAGPGPGHFGGVTAARAGMGPSPPKQPHLSREAPPRAPRDLSRTPSSNKPQAGSSGGVGAVRYANDCEIIVTAKQQEEYAEMIEKAIKSFNLKVDLMFPKPDVKLTSFIDNIASMGTIFAIVIRQENEAHRSLSVHVLRGTLKPEEHRNMPLNAAYSLIKDKYYEFKKKEIGVIPDKIRATLGLLLEERQLTDHEYAGCIRFLQERRRKQTAFENRTNNIIGGNGGVDELIESPEAQELKEKIFNILTGEEPRLATPGDKMGNLSVPRPSEPLGSLESNTITITPELRSVINNLSGGSNSENRTGYPQGSNMEGFGAGLPRGQGSFGRGMGF